MRVEFDVKMNTGYMYDFLLNHMYRRFQGIFSVVLGLAAIGLCIFTWGKVQTPFTMAYGFFGIMFLVYLPFTLFTKAKRQVLLTPMFKKPLHYLVDDTGIKITQGEDEAFSSWDEIKKVSQSPQSVILYRSKVNAFVWPKKAIGDNYDKLMSILGEHVKTRKVK